MAFFVPNLGNRTNIVPSRIRYTGIPLSWISGKLKQNSSGFNVGYYVLAGCSDSVTYNFGTDYGVYM